MRQLRALGLTKKSKEKVPRFEKQSDQSGDIMRQLRALGLRKRAKKSYHAASVSSGTKLSSSFPSESWPLSITSFQLSQSHVGHVSSPGFGGMLAPQS